MSLYWLLLLFVFPMAFGLYAQMRIRRAYARNVEIPSRGRITGAEAAEAVMRSAGIDNVEIVQVPGQLTDHYDPIHRRLALSEHNYSGTSLAAVGVAAHEAGHAIQHKVGYAMMNLRQTMVPATQIASSVANFAMLAGFIFASQFSGLLLIGAAAMGVVCLFQFVTLPVEFDASRRAKAQLVNLGIVDRDEMSGVNETLDAAALTYVAALVASLGTLLYYVMLIMGGRRDD